MLTSVLSFVVTDDPLELDMLSEIKKEPSDSDIAGKQTE